MLFIFLHLHGLGYITLRNEIVSTSSIKPKTDGKHNRVNKGLRINILPTSEKSKKNRTNLKKLALTNVE